MATKAKPQPTAVEAPAAPASGQSDATGPAKSYIDALQEHTLNVIDAAHEVIRAKLTPDIAAAAYAKRRELIEFDLPATGAFAMVRQPDLGDSEILAELPAELLTGILVTLNQIDGGDVDITKPETIDFDRIKERAKRDRSIIDAYCLAGFVEPPLIWDEASRTSDDQVLLEMIHPSDRAAFFNWCNTARTEATSNVTTFPGRPDEDVAVG